MDWMVPMVWLPCVIISSILLLLVSAGRKGGDGAALPPGPKGWPIIGNFLQLGLKPHLSLQALAKLYGPILRLRLGNKEVIVASTASAAELFLRTHDANFCGRPQIAFGEVVLYGTQDLVLAPHGPRWRLLRKLCATHMFSAKAMDDFRHVREEETARMARGMAVDSGPVRVLDAVEACVTNVLMRTLTGRRVLEREWDHFHRMLSDINKLSGAFFPGDFFPRWIDFQGLLSKMKNVHRRFDKYFNEIIEEHLQEKKKFNGSSLNESRNLLSCLLEIEDSQRDGVAYDSNITRTNTKALLLDMLVAGMETTSNTIEWALSELIRQPELLVRAQDELDSVAGFSRMVTESDLLNLPLLQAIVKETLRLHPAVALNAPLSAIDDCQVESFIIPKGTVLFVNIWALGRDPDLWPDNPLMFCPDRFLPGSAHESVDVKGSHFALMPFGAGRRICAGMNLALRMIHFFTAVLIHSFNWRLPDGLPHHQLNMNEAYGTALRKAIPLLAHAEPRLAPHLYH